MRSTPFARSGITLMLAGSIVLLAGCGGGEPADTAEPIAVATSETPSAETPSAETPSAAAADEHAHGAEGDGETLLVIMQSLGTYMASLTHGLLTDDATLVETSAASIADHASVAPSEIERIKSVLGTEMAEFGRLDEVVHTTSVQLHEAAAAGNTDAVLTKLSEVQRGCVACHTAFRERLRTNPAP